MRHFSRKNNTGSLQASVITASAAIMNIARKKRYSLLKMAANGRITYAFRSPMLLQDSQKCKHRTSRLYTFTNLARELSPLGTPSQQNRTRKGGPVLLLKEALL